MFGSLFPVIAAAAADDLLPEKSVGVLDRPRPEFAPVGVRLGAWQLNPSVGFGAEYNDNVYPTDSVKQADLIGELSGEVRLTRRGGIVPLSAHAEVSSLSYRDNPSEDRVDWEAGFATGYAGGRRNSIALDSVFVSGHEDRVESSVPLASLRPPRFTSASGKLDFNHRFASGQLDLRSDFRSLNFYDTPLRNGELQDQDYRDRNTLILEAEARFAIRRAIGALVRVTRREDDHKITGGGALNRDSVSNAVYGGAAFEITDLMRGYVGLGVLSLDNADPGARDRDSLAVSTNVEFYATQLLTLTLDVQRSSGAADIAEASSYIGTDASLRADYELRRNFIISISASTSRREYTGIADSESTERASARGTWKLNRRMSVGLAYSWEKSRWPVERGNRDYDQGIASLDARLAL